MTLRIVATEEVVWDCTQVGVVLISVHEVVGDHEDGVTDGDGGLGRPSPSAKPVVQQDQAMPDALSRSCWFAGFLAQNLPHRG